MILQFLITTVLALIVGGIFLWLRDSYFDAVPRSYAIVSALIAAAIVVGLTRRVTAFRRECTYTGEKGAARFIFRGGTLREPKSERLLFADAAELRSGLKSYQGPATAELRERARSKEAEAAGLRAKSRELRTTALHQTAELDANTLRERAARLESEAAALRADVNRQHTATRHK